ncbi:hypothetical protein ABIE56_000968 [Luteibacter sp. 621]|uniref:hypothetical protein n=1 Tax=Luteibacter sp. 621 TaxID=3373916 RepID=UPI003D207EC3
MVGYLALVQASCAQTVQVESGWSILSALATAAAAVVALGLGLYQWGKDRKRQADVRTALATALCTDLATWQTVVNQQSQTFKNAELKSEADYKGWVHRLRAPTLPTFERFYLMLPDLGQDISSVVVRAYTEIMRVGELINAEITKPGMTDRAYVDFAGFIQKELVAHSGRIGAAMNVLRPYASD